MSPGEIGCLAGILQRHLGPDAECQYFFLAGKAVFQTPVAGAIAADQQVQSAAVKQLAVASFRFQSAQVSIGQGHRFWGIFAMKMKYTPEDGCCQALCPGLMQSGLRGVSRYNADDTLR